ncbi:hypothetical protein IMAU30109_01997 [Lactobacillus helveticus]|uniref:EpsG family protein n=1 Tax=Lactobacillus helveticus TaxID=1587 RepID=UPI0015627D96|nr:EpsG family protein [Lactobacillus helveticus]NRO03035.1 hypothetical protein [Lactobacillus helveticus]
MIAYFVCFGITGVFAAVNDYSLQKKEKILAIVTAFFVVIIPAILAGIRSYDIGTDVNGYVRSSFELAVNFSSLKAWLDMSGAVGFITQNLEKGFLLVEYISTKISKDTHFFLFLVAFIENLFIYLGLFKLRNKCNVFIGEMVFLFTQYNSFFNMMRQGIAMSICLFALSILLANDDKKYIKFFVWSFIAFQFHGTAIISLLFLIVYLVFKNQNKALLLKQTLFLFSLLIIVISFITLVNYMVNIGVLPEHYLEYFSGGAAFQLYKISIFGILIYSCSYIILCQANKYLGKQKNIFMAMAIIDVVFMTMSNISFYLYRLATYFLLVRIFSLSQRSLYQMDTSRNIYDNPYVLYIETLISVILYFVYFIVKLNWHQTVPYMFMN